MPRFSAACWGQATPTPTWFPDAHLAALAIEHGLVVCSTDSDFARFTGVRWENPLAHETA